MHAIETFCCLKTLPSLDAAQANKMQIRSSLGEDSASCRSPMEVYSSVEVLRQLNFNCADDDVPKQGKRQSLEVILLLNEDVKLVCG